MDLPIIIKASLLHKDAQLPVFGTAGAAGADVRAVMDDGAEGILLGPGARALIQTGLAFELPAGIEIQVRPRSGLALKYGVTVLNSPGTIDSDYRGELGVILINHGPEDFLVKPGDRIAQLVFAQTMNIAFEAFDTLTKTQRGANGFGSTGVSE